MPKISGDEEDSQKGLSKNNNYMKEIIYNNMIIRNI
jgi:hypothetical protein